MKRLFAAIMTLALVGGLALAQAPANTYVYQSFGGVDSLDPAQAYDTASGGILENIYETLVDYEGESVTDFVPALATEWEISEDGTVFTYTLREGVTFHSGNEFSCRDVEYTFERALVHNPPDAGVWFLAETLVGTEANANDALGEDATDEDFAEYWQMIENAVQCLDDYTVQFNLTQPDPAFFFKMMASMPSSIIDSQWTIDNGMWDGTEETWREWIGVDLRQHFLHDNPSGTGAYRLVNWDGDTVVAERFDDYWGEAPAIENVIAQRVEEQSARVLALQQGDADRIELGDRATLAQLRGAPGVAIHEEADWVSTTVGVLFFNHNVNIENNPDVGSGQLDGNGIPADFFADADLRKCLTYSFDQEQFIQQIYQGEGQPITMALPPGFLGYDPDLPIYTLDPERAEEHCRAAHGGQVWEQGFEFTATYNAGNTTRQTALEIVKDNVEFLNPNFRMNIRSLAWPEFLAHTDQGFGTMFALGWAPSYADPDYFIHPFYHSQGFYANRTNFAEPELDALVDEARVIVDDDERAEIYREIGRIGYDLAPFLPYPSPTVFIVTRDNIAGVYRNPMYSDQFLWKDIAKN
jgi:peptide/nickel transport system substrate-binding protein